jgi:DNA invertase Pin-like site-specific DNA recombinase
MSFKDILIIDTVETLGKSLLVWLEVLSMIFSQQINLYIIDGKYVLKSPSRHGHWSVLFLKIAEKERELISRRAKAGIEKRRQAGVKLGRPAGMAKSVFDDHREEIGNMMKNGVTQAFIAKKLGLQPAALSYWLKKRGLR